MLERRYQSFLMTEFRRSWRVAGLFILLGRKERRNTAMKKQVMVLLALVLWILCAFVAVGLYQYHWGPGQRKDICVMTYFDGGGKMAGSVGAVAMANKKRYCEIHDYRFFQEDTSLDPERAASWVKLLHVQRRLMDPGCQWVFFMDADTLITNANVSLESIVEGRSEDIFFAKDSIAVVNGGVFITRRTPYVVTFLTRVYSQTYFINHGWWEQAAIQYIINSKDPRDEGRIAILPQRTMNSFWPLPGWFPSNEERRAEIFWQRGDFMVHFASRPNPKEHWNVTEFILSYQEDILV